MNYFNYFTEIEETFIRRRGKHLLLSPLDWALIESWQEREIPLRIVLRGIESVFDAMDKNPNRQRTIKSLSYCRDEIEAQYQNWLGAQVGKPKSEKEDSQKPEKQTEPQTKTESTLFSNQAIDLHLENVCGAIEKAKAKATGNLRQVLDSVTESLSEQKKAKPDAERLEESLNELERKIDKILLSSSDEKKIELIKNKIEKELSPHKLTMQSEVYQRTFELMLIKELREESEIPALSLFYL